MSHSRTSRFVSSLFAFLVWFGVAMSATYWFLTISATSKPTPSYATIAGNSSTEVKSDWSKLLGKAPEPTKEAVAAPPTAASRIKLIGIVVDSKNQENSFALISVDAGVTRTLRINMDVIQGISLKVIMSDYIELQDKADPHSLIKITIPHQNELGSFYVGSKEYAAPTPKVAGQAQTPPMPTQEVTTRYIENINDYNSYEAIQQRQMQADDARMMQEQQQREMFQQQEQTQQAVDAQKF